jgi:hypothetical protein
MFNSTVLEVGIGMVFCFASVSLIVSQINEGISSALQLRAKGLLKGVKQLLNDPNFSGLAKTLYQHALVNPLDPGTATSQKGLKALPSYIDPVHFARAFIDNLQTAAGAAGVAASDLQNAIDAIPDLQIRNAVTGMYQRANRTVTDFEKELVGWFDQGMDRVSGGYKRATQLICVTIAFLVAAAFNIDSVHLFSAIWSRPAYTAQIGANDDRAAASLHEAVDAMKELPIGWTAKAWSGFDLTTAHTWQQISGWLLTALSALFGAPFWFDTLQRLVQLRGTGRRPDDETKE